MPTPFQTAFAILPIFIPVLAPATGASVNPLATVPTAKATSSTMASVIIPAEYEKFIRALVAKPPKPPLLD